MFTVHILGIDGKWHAVDCLPYERATFLMRAVQSVGCFAFVSNCSNRRRIK